MFFAKMAERKVVPFDEFYYQLKLMYLFQKHPVYVFTMYKQSTFVKKLSSRRYLSITVPTDLIEYVFVEKQKSLNF
jgi:hypothetical protein